MMQSDRNSYCGDVVLDSFYLAYRDGDSILEHEYGNHIIIEYSVMKILKLSVKLQKNAHRKQYST